MMNMVKSLYVHEWGNQHIIIHDLLPTEYCGSRSKEPLNFS